MQSKLSQLLDQLVRSEFFEDAAPHVLRAMLETATEALGANRLAQRGRMRRAMIHLRPADGYRRLVSVEADRAAETAIVDPAAPAPYLPSATAWRWVAQHRAAVSIDVPLGRVEVHGGDAPGVVQEHGGPGVAFDSTESAQRLLDRDVTHLCVLPLRGRGGAIEGMVSIEADCQAAIGQNFLWPTPGRALQILADVAAPYLGNLPLRPDASVTPDEFLPVVGPTMAGVVRMLDVFARQDETVLIGGPTGAGKSRLARFCHERSRRRTRRFEAIDLNAVSEELQLAELFGWKKGAFTGAVKDNPGCIARVEGGTLFIDEIDKLSRKAQSGLLQVLEDRTYRQLGEGSGALRADVRFIIGTNADLRAEVESGRFREDLYYRINVLPIRLPALVDRRDEIVPWARYMAGRRHRSDVPGGEARLSPGAEQLLIAEPWPGNLRQLDNIIRRAYALAVLDHGGAPRDVLLRDEHVERALGYDRRTPRRPLLDALRAAAAAYVDEAERFGAADEPLDLDLAEAFRGLVLGAAMKRLGSRDAAFKLLGKASLVANRNHHKALRREAERVEELGRKLGASDAVLLAGLVDEDPP